MKKIYITETQYKKLFSKDDIGQYVKEYNEWNEQGGENSGYAQPTEYSVFEFFQNNHEDYCKNKELIIKVLTKLKRSKIKENNKQPIILYHGSNYKIDKFTTDYVSGKKSMDVDGPGIYCTDNKEYAQRWGNHVYTIEIDPNILLSNINKKPLTRNIIMKLIKMSEGWEMSAYNFDEDLNKGLEKSISSILSNNNGKDSILELYNLYYRLTPKGFIKNLSNVGIDGLFVKRQEGPSHVVIYNPSIIQIKNIERISINESNQTKYKHIANKITNNIPNEFKQKVDEYINTKKLVQFKVNDVTVFIYDSSINRTQTGTPIYPKHIYLNVDYLSDVPNVVLMSQSNIYIELYYAFMHEMGHIESKIPPESMPDVDYEKYINSKAEKHAIEYADKWLLSYLN